MNGHSSLPVVTDGPHLSRATAAQQAKPDRRSNSGVLFLARMAILIAIVFSTRNLQQRAEIGRLLAIQDRDLMSEVQKALPDARLLVQSFSSPEENRSRDILNSQGTKIGWITKTLPVAQKIVGFSGPSDILLIFDTNNRLAGSTLLYSGDTNEHVDMVVGGGFLEQFHGSVPSTLASKQVDGVSGATLTSMAMLAAIREAMRPLSLQSQSGTNAKIPQPPASLKFPDAPPLEYVQLLFPRAYLVETGEDAVWQALDAEGYPIGKFIRSAPASDNTIGYQGPSDTLIEIRENGLAGRIAVGDSYDNEPYVSYVRTDRSFPGLLEGKAIADLGPTETDRNQPGFSNLPIEGVSGATMTSLAVAESLPLAIGAYQEAVANRSMQASNTPADSAGQNSFSVSWSAIRRSISITLIVILVSRRLLKHPRAKKRSKWHSTLERGCVILFLGILNGDLLSLALLQGWALYGAPIRSGIWFSALPLMLLATLGMLFPAARGKNVYCANLCAHGALQQIVRNRPGRRFTLSLPWSQRLSHFPSALLVFGLLIPVLGIPVSTVNLEPFDAWLWQISGLVPIAIFALSLLASIAFPMAYCRFGCPTGRLLDHFRWTAGIRWSWLDTGLSIVLATAIIKMVVG